MAQKNPMNAIIFAGGIGTRMWPFSRKSSPKQFEPIINGKSTLQLTVERVRPEFAWGNIYISSGIQYIDIIKKQLPDIPANNIIGEPEMRDVAPAVGYVMGILAKKNPDTPSVILWSDHIVEKTATFKAAIQAAGTYLTKHPDRIVYLGQKPRFANQNLGWIEYGDEIEVTDGFEIHEFISWHYRPDIATAKAYFKDNRHAWNPGYWVTTPGYIIAKYQQYAPKLYQVIDKLSGSFGTDKHQSLLNRLYPTMEKIDFDSAIVEKIPPGEAVVMSVEMGWSDVGTWESLKEALQSSPSENVVQGNVYTHKTTDSIIYSNTGQLVTAIDLEGIVVVVTDDAIMVTRQQSIPEIKKMLKDFEGTDKERYT
jgi:mannose-1-phosphate guanylyltransferase